MTLNGVMTVTFESLRWMC